LQLADTKWGIWILFIFAFADASFLPLPVTTLFLILLLLNTGKAYKYVLFVVSGTLAGAFTGYLIGHFAWIKPNGEFTGLVQFLFNNIPGFSEGAYDKIHSLFTKWDYWILCGATITPVPYSVFSISSGVFEINIFLFLLATLVCQSIKFFILAFVTIRLGTEVKKLMELNWKPVAIITTLSILVILILKVF
jgi:membrane protein YqaA with SNARE-associated domain